MSKVRFHHEPHYDVTLGFVFDEPLENGVPFSIYNAEVYPNFDDDANPVYDSFCFTDDMNGPVGNEKSSWKLADGFLFFGQVLNYTISDLSPDITLFKDDLLGFVQTIETVLLGEHDRLSVWGESLRFERVEKMAEEVYEYFHDFIGRDCILELVVTTDITTSPPKTFIRRVIATMGQARCDVTTVEWLPTGDGTFHFDVEEGLKKVAWKPLYLKTINEYVQDGLENIGVRVDASHTLEDRMTDVKKLIKAYNITRKR